MNISLSRKEVSLIVGFLDEYGDRLGNDGCNDWDFPSDWSKEEKQAFTREYHEWNGDPEEYDSSMILGSNSSAVNLLYFKLKAQMEL